MVINISVRYDGGFLPDITLVSLARHSGYIRDGLDGGGDLSLLI